MALDLYRCACGEELEYRRPITSQPQINVNCPKCGKHMRRHNKPVPAIWRCAGKTSNVH